MALKVLTFNVWGLHFLANNIQERLCAIVKELKSYDIIGLQEIWSKEDYKYLVRELKDSLPFSFQFYSATIGSGLCVFSRYPIMSTNAHQFSASGVMREVLDGEMFAGKSVMACRIRTPWGPVLFLTAHINPRCRESQIFEIAQLIEHSRGRDPVILTGDFNTKDYHPAYGLITKYLKLEDAFAGSTLDTCDLKSNIYTKKHMSPKRIDYVFFSDEKCPTMELEIQSKKLSLTGHIPGKSIPYSDHEGVEVIFNVKEKQTAPTVKEEPFGDEVLAVLEDVVQKIEVRKKKYQVSHHHVMGLGLVLFIVSVLLSLLLGGNSVLTILGQYYLGFFITVVMGFVGAGSLAMWLTALINLNHANVLESHINMIRLKIKYNRYQLESRNGSTS